MVDQQGVLPIFAVQFVQTVLDLDELAQQQHAEDLLACQTELAAEEESAFRTHVADHPGPNVFGLDS